MSDFVVGLMGERRKRLVGSLLGYMEDSEWWSTLEASEKRSLREHVLTSVGSYHDIVLDVLKAATPDTVVSADAINMIVATHDRVVRMEREFRKEE